MVQAKFPTLVTDFLLVNYRQGVMGLKWGLLSSIPFCLDSWLSSAFSLAILWDKWEDLEVSHGLGGTSLSKKMIEEDDISSSPMQTKMMFVVVFYIYLYVSLILHSDSYEGVLFCLFDISGLLICSFVAVVVRLKICWLWALWKALSHLNSLCQVPKGIVVLG